MDALVYAANLLYLSAYMVKDMLHLRILTIVATSMLAIYFYSQPEPMMTVVFWNLFFMAVNAGHIVYIARLRGRNNSVKRARQEAPGANQEAIAAST